MTSLYYFLLILFLALSFFLILLILVQKGRGGGLSSAFGGVGGNTAFGAKTGDVLTWATSTVFGAFLLLAIGLNLIANHVEKQKKAEYAVPTTVPSGISNDSLPVPDSMPMPAPVVTPSTQPAAAVTASPVAAPAVAAPGVAVPTTQK